jgi:ABC-type glycerol-3-phosphate transport system permease component
MIPLDKTVRPDAAFRPGRVLVFAILFLYLVAVVYPMLWLFYTSLKPDHEIFLDPFALPRWNDLHWENFQRAWTGAHFSRYFINSFIVTVGTLLGTLVLSSMSAYALSRFKIAGGKAIFYTFLIGLMIPGQLSIVPLFFQMRKLGLLNSRLGLILVYTAGGLPFAIFILAAFFKSLPRSLYEAAQIDGCGEWRAFWSIMLPLARPGLITVALFTALGAWNEYFTAFMFLSGSEGTQTLPLGLAQITITSQYRSDWGVAFAGLAMVTLPTLVFYVFMQKHLIKGIVSGAVKG